MTMTQSDESLLEQWRSGDKSAGQQLFNRHFKSIYRYFSSRAPSESKDLTQKTFSACLESQASFAGRSAFRTWLFGIARNVLRDHLARRYRSVRECTFEESMAELLPQAQTLDDMQPQTRLLLLALRRLPLPTQLTLVLHYWENLSTPQIAELLEQPLGTVTARLKRGRDQLNRLIVELASSAEERESTLQNFDRWVSEVRAHSPSRPSDVAATETPHSVTAQTPIDAVHQRRIERRDHEEQQ